MSAAMPLLEDLCLPRLSLDVCVDLGLVGVVVGKRRMNLRQRKVAKLSYDLFRNQAHAVPLRNPAN